MDHLVDQLRGTLVHGSNSLVSKLNPGESEASQNIRCLGRRKKLQLRHGRTRV